MWHFHFTRTLEAKQVSPDTVTDRERGLSVDFQLVLPQGFPPCCPKRGGAHTTDSSKEARKAEGSALGDRTLSLTQVPWGLPMWELNSVGLNIRPLR